MAISVTAHLGAEDDVFGGSGGVPLESAVFFVPRPIEGLRVAHVHAEREIIVDGNDVRKGPRTPLGSVKLSEEKLHARPTKCRRAQAFEEKP